MPAPYKLTWHENTHLCLCRQGASNIHYFFCDFRYSNCLFFLWGENKDYTPVSYMNSWRICFILLKSNITKVKSVDALNSKQYSWKKSSVRKEKKDNQYAIVMWSRFSLSELWNWKLLLKKKKKKKSLLMLWQRLHEHFYSYCCFSSSTRIYFFFSRTPQTKSLTISSQDYITTWLFLCYKTLQEKQRRNSVNC